MIYGPATEARIKEVVEACELHGKSSIIALAGVPGTGKSHVALPAAQRFAGEPTRVLEIQFHQSFSYEEFIEGMRIDANGSVLVKPGVLIDWNQVASDDPTRHYVLLIEEFTRANLPAVLGEVMTYVEHRERYFRAVYSRTPIRLAENLTLIATYNPTDRSALELDAAILRRLRVIRFLPDTAQLEEMLSGALPPKVIAKLKGVFDSCKMKHADDYEYTMPFGHGIFAGVKSETPDLHKLWVERIELMLRRPSGISHPFVQTITDAYPWRDPRYTTS